MDRRSREIPEGYQIASKIVQLRGGRTQEISYLVRTPPEAADGPEELSPAEKMSESLVAAFRHLLDADEFDDDEAGNIYTYAHHEDVPREVIDACWQRALVEANEAEEA